MTISSAAKFKLEKPDGLKCSTGVFDHAYYEDTSTQYIFVLTVDSFS